MRWVLLTFAVLGACRRSTNETAPLVGENSVRRNGRIEIPPTSPLRQRLRIAAVRAQSVRRTLEAPAEVEADPERLVRITPPIAGRVVQLFVHFGDRVTAGQPLFVLDAPELVAAQTDYLRARSGLAQAERTLARQRDLATHGIGAQREVEQAETDRDLARSEQERSAIRLRLLGMDPGSVGRPLSVRSPIAGRIVEYRVARGEYRNDLAQPLMTIADLSSVWVRANVQEKDIRRVRVGEDATAVFAAYPAERLSGSVRFVGDLLDPGTRTIQVRVGFDNTAGRLRPGMFATVTFTETAAPELVVPTAAVVLVGDASFVFVETSPWVFERRRINPGAQIESLTVVADGLAAGERVVVGDAVLLQ